MAGWFDLIATAAGAALSLEPLAWRGPGTVSRFRDHEDKGLTSYVALSHRLRYVSDRECRKPLGCRGHHLFRALAEDMIMVFSTNLSLGSLLQLSLHLAPYSRPPVHSGDKPNPRRLSERALGEAMMFPFSTFLNTLRVIVPRYAGRLRSWLFPDIGEPWPRDSGLTLWRASRLVSEFDPVFREVYEGWPGARRLALTLVSRVGGRVPSSSDIEWLYREACALMGRDYLAFRRMGVREMSRQVRACAEGRMEEATVSLGSIADVVVMAVFYHLVEAWSH